MKIRTGFVSNSSSSSFIIKLQSPGDVGAFLSALQLPEGHPLHNTYKELFTYIQKSRYAKFINDAESLYKFLEEDEISELPEDKPSSRGELLDLARTNRYYKDIIDTLELKNMVYIEASLSYNEDETEMYMAHLLEGIPTLEGLIIKRGW